MSNFLISPIVAQQLPDFVRSEYSIFVTFLEKYYEIKSNVLYFNEIGLLPVQTSSLKMNNRQYLLGVVISDFKRKIKNVKYKIILRYRFKIYSSTRNKRCFYEL